MSAETTAPLGRPFWTVFASSTLSGLGDGLRYVALPLLASALTRDPRLVSLVGVASFLPVVLFGLLSGAVADRVDRRRLMWRSDLARTLLAAVLTVLVVSGLSSIWPLLAITFALGVLGIFFDNTATAFVPMLVEADELPRANGLLFGGQTVTGQFLGPAVGGVLFAVSTALPFGIDAATFAGSALLLLLLGGTYRAHDDAPTTHLRTDIAEGLRWLWEHRLLRTLALLLAVLNGVVAGAEAVLVLFVLEVLHEPRAVFAVLLVCLAAGSLLGALGAARVNRRWSATAVALASTTAAAVALSMFALTASLWVSVVACVLFGVAGTTWNVVTISLRQRVVPPRLLGRVSSAYRLVGLGAMPVGAGAGGLVAHRFGLHAPYLAGAVLLFIATLVFRRPLRVSAADAV